MSFSGQVSRYPDKCHTQASPGTKTEKSDICLHTASPMHDFPQGSFFADPAQATRQVVALLVKAGHLSRTDANVNLARRSLKRPIDATSARYFRHVKRANRTLVKKTFGLVAPMYTSGIIHAAEQAYEEDRALGQRSFHVRRGIDIIADVVDQESDADRKLVAEYIALEHLHTAFGGSSRTWPPPSAPGAGAKGKGSRR